MSLNMFKTVGAFFSQTQTTVTSAAGTADDTVADVGTEFSQSTLNNNFASIVAQLDLIKADVAALMDALNKANGAV